MSERKDHTPEEKDQAEPGSGAGIPPLKETGEEMSEEQMERQTQNPGAGYPAENPAPYGEEPTED